MWDKIGSFLSDATTPMVVMWYAGMEVGIGVEIEI